MSKYSLDHYALFYHDPFLKLAIDASSCIQEQILSYIFLCFFFLSCRRQFGNLCFGNTPRFDTSLRNKGYCKSWNAQADESLRKICHYQQNVPQHYYIPWYYSV